MGRLRVSTLSPVRSNAQQRKELPLAHGPPSVSLHRHPASRGLGSFTDQHGEGGNAFSAGLVQE